ncbi:class I SAM-dependent methyltransferase [Dictyobacter kobayashii]|uniref:Methyltransferase domain-containing protein n=1 Tax=Dictyobacter kobayashii TaxID=2014872 RepID=A0A402AS05_9CHLR|nr:class I SAM-dependent methyltransferase [Dictyobacter kobayashii]GCE21876.1 hypothetical protein KDK_56760 [Dictyobacter kobayashii]
MPPEPNHLQAKEATRFQEQSIVDNYQYRFPYPPETFSILADLLKDHPYAVLDAGTGLGDLARPLAALVDRVDAIDLSSPMTRKGRSLPGGHHPNLRWTTGAIEQVKLRPPYSLITAGDSLQWMDWDIVLSRFASALTPHGTLALVSRQELWPASIQQLLEHYAIPPTPSPFDLAKELERHHLFQPQGEHTTQAITYTDTEEKILAALHAQISLSPQRMPTTANITAFNQNVHDLLAPQSQNGQLKIQYTATITWGKPL